MRVAIVGCGGQGHVHAAAYSQIEGVQVVGCCDVLADRANKLANELGAQAFYDYKVMLETLQPDIVSVCTLEGQHSEPTIEALRAGAHVLCEKMLSANLEEAKAMLETAREVGKILATQFNYRHIPSIQWLKSLLEDGSIGKPLLVTLMTHGYCHHHGIDLLRFLFGEIVAVQATLRGDRSEVPYRGFETGISEDLLYIPSQAMGAVLHFEEGFVGVLASSIKHRLDDFMLELHLLTDKGRIALRRMKQANICGELDTNLDLEKAPQFPNPLPFVSTFAPSIHAFVAAVKGEPATIATGEDGLKAMEIEHAIVIAHRTERKVEIA
ncbi:MAG: Gfo/Idh/MocA family oxidoreductase [Armatimonadetes bacterium]|nr:Gfo/Idh/MocA family oxidoreductase [Armatimonadota bacterium]MDW8027818.1 Gfo/Idh/MocA family oxidoreductase [Armatimonadota bacterium]